MKKITTSNEMDVIACLFGGMLLMIVLVGSIAIAALQYSAMTPTQPPARSQISGMKYDRLDFAVD